MKASRIITTLDRLKKNWHLQKFSKQTGRYYDHNTRTPAANQNNLTIDAYAHDINDRVLIEFEINIISENNLSFIQYTK